MVLSHNHKIQLLKVVSSARSGRLAPLRVNLRGCVGDCVWQMKEIDFSGFLAIVRRGISFWFHYSVPHYEIVYCLLS